MEIAEFIRLFSLRAPKIMWFLGAGASSAAGVPTAYHLTWRFKQQIYCAEQRISTRSCADLGDPTLQSRIQSYFDGKSGYPHLDSESEYAHYFEAAFPDESDRRRYLDGFVSSGSPSYGHLALAILMAQDRSRIIWTTNFDVTIEDAFSIIAGSGSGLTIATPDAPRICTDAIRDERYPILTKLHGDFRSRRLKNTTDELRKQEAELRDNLIASCQRYGLVVVGYSGRDHSIMDALEAVAENSSPFPHGLFWFHRPDGPCFDRVTRLVQRVRDAGSQAHVIGVDTFDELLSDVIHQVPDIPDKLLDRLSRKRTRLSPIPVTNGNSTWPVLRLNALPVISSPRQCRRVVCNIGGTKEVRDAVRDAAADVIAVRSRTGVLALVAMPRSRKYSNNTT